MTARDNSVTKRDSKLVANAGPKWSMPAHDVRSFMQSFGRLGHDIDSLLAAAGFCGEDLNNREARISCEALGAILIRAQQEHFTPNLGVELARVTPIGAYPLLDYLVATSDTVGEGIQQLSRYYQVVGNSVTLEVKDAGNPIRIEMPETAAPFSVEFSASLLILHFRDESDGRFTAGSVSFMHRADDASVVERALGCPVYSPAEWNGVSVSREAWHVPLRRRDPVLRDLLETHANEIVARLPRREGLALEVQRALAARVTGSDTGINALAREFAMSPRTLQRRLGAEGVSYHELREDARKKAAGQYLGESLLTINEIAYLVGYSESASFYRAFKRWYGMTPDVFRQKRRQSPSDRPQ
jgi:AraC-like DNA-binding protein